MTSLASKNKRSKGIVSLRLAKPSKCFIAFATLGSGQSAKHEVLRLRILCRDRCDGAPKLHLQLSAPGDFPPPGRAYACAIVELRLAPAFGGMSGVARVKTELRVMR